MPKLCLSASLKNAPRIALVALSIFVVLAPVTAIGQSGTWRLTSSMNTTRYAFSATLLKDGRVLVAGGCSPCGDLADSAEIYDPATGRWSPTGSMNEKRCCQVSILLPSGLVLVAGGQDSGPVSATAELYDPKSGTWRFTGTMNTPRRYPAAILIKDGPNAGKVLVAGGEYGPEVATKTAELYDPTSETWSSTGSMSIPRYFGEASPVILPDNTSVFVVGGTKCCPYYSFNEAEVYDSVTGIWRRTAGKHTASNGRAVLLRNGQVLVAGGSFGGSLVSAELYDSTADVWTRTGKMTTDRDAHTLTLLNDGRPLAAGGNNTSCVDLSSAELYDIAGGKWVSTGGMAVARTHHTATLLGNGQVLVAGGFACPTGESLSSAELYTP